jgi:hypothetical protein
MLDLTLDQLCYLSGQCEVYLHTVMLTLAPLLDGMKGGTDGKRVENSRDIRQGADGHRQKFQSILESIASKVGHSQKSRICFESMECSCFPGRSDVLPVLQDNMNKKLQEFAGHYVLLERLYMQQTLHIATHTCELWELESDVYITTAIVDSFDILKKCYQRACSSLSDTAVLATINALIAQLQMTSVGQGDTEDSPIFRSILETRKLELVLKLKRSQAPKDETAHDDSDVALQTEHKKKKLGGATNLGNAFDDFLEDQMESSAMQQESILGMVAEDAVLHLNCVDRASHCVIRLRDEILVQGSEGGHFSEFTQALIKPSLAELEEVANSYSVAADSVAHSLVGKGTWLDTWTRRLKRDVLLHNYNIRFEQTEEGKLEHKSFILAIDDIESDESMERCQRGLMRSSFERLMKSIAMEFATCLEEAIFENGRFSQAGGILLRREVQESIVRISSLIDNQQKRKSELQAAKVGDLSGHIDARKFFPCLYY